jgi:hypothetical protein
MPATNDAEETLNEVCTRIFDGKTIVASSLITAHKGDPVTDISTLSAEELMEALTPQEILVLEMNDGSKIGITFNDIGTIVDSKQEGHEEAMVNLRKASEALIKCIIGIDLSTKH